MRQSIRRGAYAGLGMFSCPTVVPVVVVVVVQTALFKLPLPDVARKFICSSSTVADMVVVPTLDNRRNIKTQMVVFVLSQIRNNFKSKALIITLSVLMADGFFAFPHSQRFPLFLFRP